MIKPLCFVLMPLGENDNPSGNRINFDVIYDHYLCPALEKAGLEPLRAELEATAGTPTKATLEGLLLCEYAIVDIAMVQPNVLYWLGIRHATRPYKTVLIYSKEPPLPAAANREYTLAYTLLPDGTFVNKEEDIDTLARTLQQLKTQNHTDSSLFLLFDERPAPILDHEKTDVFRDRAVYMPFIKDQLKEARQNGLAAVKQIEAQWGDIKDLESGIVVDLLLSYRATNGYQEIIALVEKMSPCLARRLLIQEQLAFALNRNGQGDQAEKILETLLTQYGPSSETYALLGRIYKDRYDHAIKQQDSTAAATFLERAITMYLQGFQADWRDAFPGINAVTLMEIADPDDPRKNEILPVVTYAVKRKIADGTPDYWDYATLLELAVLANNRVEANNYVKKCQELVRETWEPQTTARNLQLIREAREKRGIQTSWITEIEGQLTR